jgi:hypothetical protein
VFALIKIKEIVIGHTGQYAIVVDEYNEQWFYQMMRKENQSYTDFFVEVLLNFITKRCEFFHCDVV